MRIDLQLLLLAFLLIGFRGNTQNVSLEQWERHYVAMSDSLLHQGKYEEAMEALAESRNYLGDEPQTGTQNEIYIKRYMRLDSLVQQLSPTDKFNSRIKKANDNFELGFVDEAMYWLDKAKEYDKKSQLPAQRKYEMICQLPTDTVYSEDTIPWQLHKHKPKGIFIGTKGLPMYLVKDSSLFEGVWIEKINDKRNKDIGYDLHTKNYKDGLLESEKIETFRHDYSDPYGDLFFKSIVTVESNDTTISIGLNNKGERRYIQKRFESDAYFLHSFLTLEAEEYFEHYIEENWLWNGTTARYTETNLDSNGDTITSLITSSWKDLEIVRSILLDSGDTIEYFVTKQDYYEGPMLRSYSSDFHGNSKSFSIRCNWKNGNIEDIYNDDIIYLDGRKDIITEEEYIQIAGQQRIDDFLVKLIPSENHKYNLIVYTNIELPPYNVDKLLKKKLRMDKKATP